MATEVWTNESGPSRGTLLARTMGGTSATVAKRAAAIDREIAAAVAEAVKADRHERCANLMRENERLREELEHERRRRMTGANA